MQQRTTEESAISALAVFLQHPAVAAEQQNICKLLQVSRACRAAVQQSAAGLTNVVAALRGQHKDLPRVADLGAWISSYSSLISSISISTVSYRDWYSDDYSCKVARRVLELALQLAAAGTGIPYVTKPVAAHQGTTAAAGLPALQQLWRVQSYKSDLLITPVMLAALPAASMTQLDVQSMAKPDWAAIAANLQRLANLQQLSLGSSTALPVEMFSAVGALKQLTSLTLSTAGAVAGFQLLPAQLQQLTVHVGPYQLDIGHLTCLTQLKLHADAPVGMGSVLPAQLQQLTLDSHDGSIAPLAITSLKQLQYLSIKSVRMEAEQLRTLSGMTQIQQLKLWQQHYHEGVGEVWRDLPMLRSLEVVESSHLVEDLPMACSMAGTARSVTQLCLNLQLIGDDDVDVPADLGKGSSFAIILRG